MFRNFFDELRGFKESLPNKFTIHFGELIRRARLEANMTQSELAKGTYFSQTALSQIEQGKRDVTASEILYFSVTLNKPILYFFQPFIEINNEDVELSPLENELLNLVKKLSTEDLKKLIAQTKALVNLNQPDS